jgi:hypothetical protein
MTRLGDDNLGGEQATIASGANAKSRDARDAVSLLIGIDDAGRAGD